MTRTRPLIVNLFGGPGCGKSTTAAGVYYHLKMLHINVELVLEFARELTHEDRALALDNQPYIFGEQFHRMQRLVGRTDVIITDSPLAMSSAYLKPGTGYERSFKLMSIDVFKDSDNLNFFLNRGNFQYTNQGRIQTEGESKSIDQEVLNIMKDNSIDFTSVISDGTCVQEILIPVVNKIRSSNNDPKH